MTTKADFTNEEWELISSGPALAGAGVSLVDKGVLSDVREQAAIRKALATAKDEYAGNELIQAVVAHHGDADVAPAEGVGAEAILEKLMKLDAVLDAKAHGEEGTEYRNFLYNVADRAANAAGGFLGLGDKVSDEERVFLAKLKEILFKGNVEAD